MLTFAFALVPIVAILFTPFRRCLLIPPIVLAGFLGGYLAWEGLWRATGGAYGECTDVCFEPHMPGTASAAFTPLWIITLVAIVCTVIGLSFLLIRSSVKSIGGAATSDTPPVL
jgi:hypothetical protein